jgi:hypothetical protein
VEVCGGMWRYVEVCGGMWRYETIHYFYIKITKIKNKINN